ncbi:type VI secretion system baseplate subunit TssE [Dyella sp. C11]|uniref:type VI secretion system baseplate subunit TssE n=1 Tax=Dyella sp. C11 TaxID=2126991 RepID=UPI000D64547F|nr:type VI secretion system baseplate subunit TssE [Dyella sp. C11]
MPRSLGRGSLFERLEPDAPPQRVRTRQQMAAERILAVKSHLQWLLNARQGCSLSSPDLGLSDFNDAAIGSADLSLRVRLDIQRLVAAYEPRVQVLGVRLCPDVDQPLDLHFRLDCVIPVNNAEEQVEIDLLIRHQDQTARVD